MAARLRPVETRPKSVVLRFLERVSGYSRQQLTRLVKRGCERRKLVKRAICKASKNKTAVIQADMAHPVANFNRNQRSRLFLTSKVRDRCSPRRCDQAA